MTGMPVALDLPPDTQARVAAEAARRAITVDELVVQLAAALPQEILSGCAHRLGFVGIGASGRPRRRTSARSAPSG
jgi:hypothetical protein